MDTERDGSSNPCGIDLSDLNSMNDMEILPYLYNENLTLEDDFLRSPSPSISSDTLVMKTPPWKEKDNLPFTTEEAANRMLNDTCCKRHFEERCLSLKEEVTTIHYNDIVPMPSSMPSSRSILKTQKQSNSNPTLASRVLMITKPQSQSQPQNKKPKNQEANLESDGDSQRSSSPGEQSPRSESDREIESIFKHNQVNVHEYITKGVTKNSETPADEPNNNGQQCMQRHYTRRKEEETNHKTVLDKNTLRNTLSDHCYHQITVNQSIALQRLGLTQNSSSSSSETDEEVDVVSYEPMVQVKMCDDAQKKRNNQLTTSITISKDTTAKQTTVVRRPRGRPPGSTNAAKRKKTMAQAAAPIAGVKRLAPQDFNWIPQTGAQKRPRVATTTQQRGARGKGRSNQQSDDEEGKRNMHNTMERQRRISLRMLFEKLHQLVPEIADKVKAAKVTILVETKHYCHQLEEEEDYLMQKKSQLRKQQYFLRKKYEKLLQKLSIKEN